MNEGSSTGGVILATIGGVVALVAVTVGWGCWYTVEQGERGVLLRNGRVIEVVDPGFHMKLPWVDSVKEVEVRTQKLSFDKMSAYSRDIQEAILKISVNYRIQPGSVEKVYSTYGMGYAERAIWPQVYKNVKDVFGKYGAADIVASRDKLAAEMMRVMQEIVGDEGFVIEGIQLENIEFGKAYTQGIEDAARAEADVRKKRQELEQNRVTAETVKVNADAAAYKTRTEADAHAYQIEARGKAEASAIVQRAEALKKNQELVGLIAAEKWDGKLPATMVPGSAVPFIGVK